MNVSLTPELERFVQEKVHSGRYASASEVVREALRLLEEHEKVRAVQLAEFREEIENSGDLELVFHGASDKPVMISLQDVLGQSFDGKR